MRLGAAAFAIAIGSAACDQSKPELAVEDEPVGTPPTTPGTGWSSVVDHYEDFSDPTQYSARWMDVGEFVGAGEPEAVQSRGFAGGVLQFEATPFVTSHDYALDHLKHFAVSTKSYEVPLRGYVEVFADIRAITPGVTPNRLVPATGRRLLEGQQAAATLHLIDFGDTGIRFAWYVSQSRAFALYERLPLDGSCDLQNSFSQIVFELPISAATHNFGIRYLRNVGANGFADKVDWVMDGHVRARIRGAGIPLTAPSPNHPITFPAQGPGEVLDARLNRLSIGHGIGSMIDVFPFNQCSTGQVSIPESQRIYGQGVMATFDNFVVTTSQHP
jgi:hypothetical protein